MEASLKITPMEETYKDVENLIHHMCGLFMRRNGGDYDDLVSVANQVFCDVYRTWKTGLSPFSTYLSTCIYRRLLDEKRKSMKMKTVSIHKSSDGMKKGATYYEADKDIEIIDNHREFNFSEFVEELSDDARTVVTLILSTPQDIAEVIEAKGGNPKNVRSTIRDYLRDLGWAFSRITESFEEIKGVL